MTENFFRFNPTLVRLRRAAGNSGTSAPFYRFNPTLVRLRRGPGRPGPRWRSTFQSHAGSIEAWGRKSRTAAQSGKVSIPRWFD